MRKLCNCVLVCLLLAAFVWFGTVLADRQKLRQELIRIHVVANSDSSEDQFRKQAVRDAVLESLQSELGKLTDPEAARVYLQEKLPCIQQLAGTTLQALGCNGPVSVSLGEEAMTSGANGEYRLPSGFYEALRITIGDGKGSNWWSVLFPEAVPAFAALEPAETALPTFSDFWGEGAGKIRFSVLDMLGKLENIFFCG